MSDYLIYAFIGCTYCKKAIAAFEEAKLDYEVVYFKKDSNRLETIKKFYNWPTVPIIFRREENRNFFLLGGYDDLKKHLLSGWLR